MGGTGGTLLWFGLVSTANMVRLHNCQPAPTIAPLAPSQHIVVFDMAETKKKKITIKIKKIVQNCSAGRIRNHCRRPPTILDAKSDGENNDVCNVCNVCMLHAVSENNAKGHV